MLVGCGCCCVVDREMEEMQMHGVRRRGGDAGETMQGRWRRCIAVV